MDIQRLQLEAMPVENARVDTSSGSGRTAAQNFGHQLLILTLLLSTFVWMVGWHATAALSMAAIWWHSETFAHGLIIYPVAAWLIWRKRSELVHLPIRPCYSALVPLAAASVVALLGHVGGVQAAHQFGLVAMTALAVVAIAGSAVARRIAFPLAFTLLAVPIGEFLLPALMQHTADFTVAALRLSGVPVYKEGLFFTVPTGRWSVVEACSGLRYLIASFTLGLLYAYLSYRSFWRRLLFVCASLVVPIVANWLRAYMIVMIGHLSDMRYAVGVDHLIYGWVFFGIVMMLLFWIGSFWREDTLEAAPPQNMLVRSPAPSSAPSGGVVVAALCVAVLAAVGPLYADILSRSRGTLPPVLAAPESNGSWSRADSHSYAFTPHFLHARSRVHQTYETNGRKVGLFIAYYAEQREGAELIGHGNDLVSSVNSAWRRVAESTHTTQGLEVIESRLQTDREELLTWHWYWAGGHWTRRPEEVKVRQALSRLFGRGDDAAVIVLYTPSGPNAKPVLGDFLAAMQPSIHSVLEGVTHSRNVERASVSD